MKRFQREDREHTGHEIEEDSAGDRAEQRPQQRVGAKRPDRRAAFWHRPRYRAEGEAAVVAKRQHAGEFGRAFVLALKLGDEHCRRRG